MITFSSEIDSVTVYKEGALVTRKAEVVPDGDYFTAFLLGPVPLSIDDSSVKVWSDSDSKVSFPIVRVCLDLEDGEETVLSKLKDELKAAKLTVLKAESEKEVLSLSLSAIETNLTILERGEGKEGEPPEKVDFEVRKSLIAFKTQQKARLFKDLSKSEENLEELQKSEEDLYDRIDKASTEKISRENELSKLVAVTVRPLESADSLVDALNGLKSLKMYFSYFVPGARWVPSYALSFTKDYSSLDLTMKAFVAQNTTEDWSQVKVSLSTASYMSYSSLPELNALRIGHSQPEPPLIGWKPLPSGLDDLYCDYDQMFRSFAHTGSVGRTFELPVPPPSIDTFGASLLPSAEFADAMPEEMDEECDMFSDLPSPAPECKPSGNVRGRRSSSVKKKKMRKMIKSKEMAKSAPPMAPTPSLRSLASTMTGLAAGGWSGSRAPIAGALPPQEGQCFSSNDLFDDLSVDDDFLNFQNMIMPAFSSSKRGNLIAADISTTYAISFEKAKHLRAVNVKDALNAAITSAKTPLHVSLPPKTVLPDSNNDFVYIYDGEALVDIPSDNTFHSVSMLKTVIQTVLSYVSVPRVTEEVFRIATFKNTLSKPLPSGPCDVSVGSDYLLVTVLDTVAPGSNIELGLGVEQAVKIIRNTTYSENEEGFISSEFNLHHKIEIEVKNSMAKAIDIQVRERIPYVPDGVDNVSVTLENVTPVWTDYKQKGNPVSSSYCWNVTVEGKEKKKLKAHYNIEIPSAYELVGGNRREG